MASFSTSETVSRTNRSAKPQAGSAPRLRAVITAAAARMNRARKWVRPRRASDRNRSIISSAKAAPQTKISGPSGSRSAVVGIGRAIGASLQQLGGGELGNQLRDRGFHQVGQRPGTDADQQGAQGEHAQHQGLAAVDVLGLGAVMVADVAERHPLD